MVATKRRKRLIIFPVFSLKKDKRTLNPKAMMLVLMAILKRAQSTIGIMDIFLKSISKKNKAVKKEIKFLSSLFVVMFTFVLTFSN